MPNSITTVQECDARDDDSSNAVDNIKLRNRFYLQSIAPVQKLCMNSI